MKCIGKTTPPQQLSSCRMYISVEIWSKTTEKVIRPACSKKINSIRKVKHFFDFDWMKYTAHPTPGSCPIRTNKSSNERRGSCGSADVRYVCSNATSSAVMLKWRQQECEGNTFSYSFVLVSKRPVHLQTRAASYKWPAPFNVRPLRSTQLRKKKGSVGGRNHNGRPSF